MPHLPQRKVSPIVKPHQTNSNYETTKKPTHNQPTPPPKRPRGRGGGLIEAARCFSIFSETDGYM